MDVVGIGDAVLSFSPRGHLRLQQARELEVNPTESAANVCVAMARLGLDVGWITKLPKNPLGEMIGNGVRMWGVDTSRIVWAEEGRVGLIFYERGVAPRPSRVWYDRANTAFTTLKAPEIDWNYVLSARAVLMSGTAPALGAGIRQTTIDIARRVRAEKRLYALDVNFRSKLWSAGEAKACFETLLPLANIVFCGKDDAAAIFGLHGTGEDVARGMQDKFGIPVVAITMGDAGAACAADRVYTAPRIAGVNSIDAVGAGDAFAAGFLFGYLKDGVEKGLATGNALGALQCTIHGDFAISNADEVKTLLRGIGMDIER